MQRPSPASRIPNSPAQQQEPASSTDSPARGLPNLLSRKPKGKPALKTAGNSRDTSGDGSTAGNEQLRRACTSGLSNDDRGSARLSSQHSAAERVPSLTATRVKVITVGPGSPRHSPSLHPLPWLSTTKQQAQQTRKASKSSTQEPLQKPKQQLLPAELGSQQRAVLRPPLQQEQQQSVPAGQVVEPAKPSGPASHPASAAGWSRADTSSFNQESTAVQSHHLQLESQEQQGPPSPSEAEPESTGSGRRSTLGDMFYFGAGILQLPFFQAKEASIATQQDAFYSVHSRAVESQQQAQRETQQPQERQLPEADQQQEAENATKQPEQLTVQPSLEQRLLVAADLLQNAGLLEELITATSAVSSRRQSDATPRTPSTAAAVVAPAPQPPQQQERQEHLEAQPAVSESKLTEGQLQAPQSSIAKRDSLISLSAGLSPAASAEMKKLAQAADAAAAGWTASPAAVPALHAGGDLAGLGQESGPAVAWGSGAGDSSNSGAGGSSTTNGDSSSTANTRGHYIKEAYGTYPAGYPYAGRGSAAAEASTDSLAQQPGQQELPDLTAWIQAYKDNLQLEKLGTVGSCRSSTDLILWSSDHKSSSGEDSRPTTSTPSGTRSGGVTASSSSDKLQEQASDSNGDTPHPVAVDDIEVGVGQRRSVDHVRDFDRTTRESLLDDMPHVPSLLGGSRGHRRQLSFHPMVRFGKEDEKHDATDDGTHAQDLPPELLEQLRIAESLLRKHGLLDAYHELTIKSLQGTSTSSLAAPSVGTMALGSGPGTNPRSLSLINSFKGFGRQASNSMRGLSAKNLLTFGTRRFLKTKSSKSSRAGSISAAGSRGSSAPSSARTSAVDSAGNSNRNSLELSGHVHIKDAVVPESAEPQFHTARGTKGGLKRATSAKGAQDLPKEPGPLEIVWSPMAILVFTVYLIAMGYYMYVRIVTAGNLGNQKWYGMTVLAVEMFGVTSMIPYGMMLLRYSRIKQKDPNKNEAAKPAKTAAVPDLYKFHVRVMVPCYKESLGTIQNTVEAALDADLPPGSSRTVYLCDDGKDAEKKGWAATKAPNVVYASGRTRAPGEINGKSGNLNNALRNIIYKDYQSAADIPPQELVVVFDADMAAKRNFFVKVLEVMRDQDAALCLTPQAFHNVDAACDIWNHVNPQFWEYVLPGCDALGYVACTGTNVCLRARCLAQVGWFPEYTITEDYALSMELKMAGFSGRYLPEYLAVGEAPEEVRNVTRQRSRWTKGHMQIFFSRKCPLFNARLGLVHKILYTNGTWAYFATILTSFMFTLVPFNSLVFGYHPVTFSKQFTIASTAYLIAGAMLGGFIRRPTHSRGMWLCGISNNLLAFTYAKAVLNTLLSIVGFKEKAGFKATVKKLAPVVKAAEIAEMIGRVLSSVYQASATAIRRTTGLFTGQPDIGNLAGAAGTPTGLLQSQSGLFPAPLGRSPRRSSLLGYRSSANGSAPTPGAVSASPSPRASVLSQPDMHILKQISESGALNHANPRTTAQLNTAVIENGVGGSPEASPGAAGFGRSPRRSLQGFAARNNLALLSTASVADAAGADPVYSPTGLNHVLGHFAAMRGPTLPGAVANGVSPNAGKDAAAAAAVKQKDAAARAAADAEAGVVEYWWSWASENWQTLDGAMDPLVIIGSLFISCFAIGVGIQQVVKEGSKFTLAHYSSVIKMFTSGRMDEFMLLAMLWAGVNSIPPLLFLVYWWTKGRVLRWCCNIGQLLSLLMASAAIGCLWLLIPVDIEMQLILPKVVIFLDAQRSGGYLPNSTTTAYPFLQASGASDPVPGGFYMGADYVKYSVPMATSMALLAWSLHDFQEGYQRAGVYDQALDSLKHGTDYLIRCHTKPNEFVVQIGNPADYVVDLKRAVGSWGWPADMPSNRTKWVITDSSPGGSDALASAAAALASAAVTLSNTDPAIASDAINHSKQLYSMASSVQLLKQSYCTAVVPCQGSAVPLQDSSATGAAAVAAAANSTAAAEVAWVAYPSSSVYDDMAWAAAWLYRATGLAMYLADAEMYIKLHHDREVDLAQPEAWIPGLDNMGFAAGLLLSHLLPHSKYHELPTELLRGWMTTKNSYTSQINHVTPGGFLWTPAPAPAHTVAGIGMLALLYANGLQREGGKGTVIRGAECWALQQAYSLLGGPLGDSLSYVVGVGPKGWPLRPYHRQASCPSDGVSPCNPTTALLITTPNPHQLTGALVYGPTRDDGYDDSRINTAQSSVSLAGNVNLAGLLAGLIHRDVRQGGCNGGRGFVQNLLQTYMPR